MVGPGLPRPRNRDGIPVPWNAAHPDELGQRDTKRTKRTAGGWICQVCGLRLPADESAVLFGTIDPTGKVDTPAPGERIPEDVGVHAMDHGLLHRPCARIALAHCPALKAMRADGTLLAFRVPPGSIEVFGTDAIVLDLTTL